MVREYDRRAAVTYANKWAYRRNPDYYDFSELGGDCTNYISQCIYAGAGVMNYTPVTGWYYKSLNDRAPAWTGVQYLYKFLISNTQQGPFASEVELARVMPGDVIQLRDESVFYHSLIVVAAGRNPGPGNVLVNAHTLNAYRRPLSSYSYADYRVLHIEGAYD